MKKEMLHNSHCENKFLKIIQCITRAGNQVSIEINGYHIVLKCLLTNDSSNPAFFQLKLESIDLPIPRYQPYL